MSSIKASFRERLRSKESLLGTFLKTPTSHGAEIIGNLGYDFVVIDQEHGSFDRLATEVAILGARAVGISVLVRIQNLGSILSALDSGADGILAPHIVSSAYAIEVVENCRYRGGKRGFATSTRSGNYTGASMWEHISESDKNTVVIGQIEDPAALAELDEISLVNGLDALFIGRADLAAAYGASSQASIELDRAVHRICDAANGAKKPVCCYINQPDEILRLKNVGASVFVMSSDQSLLRTAAQEGLAKARRFLSSEINASAE